MLVIPANMPLRQGSCEDVIRWTSPKAFESLVILETH